MRKRSKNVSRGQMSDYVGKQVSCIATVDRKREEPIISMGIQQDEEDWYLLTDVKVSGTRTHHAWVNCKEIKNYSEGDVISFCAIVRHYGKFNGKVSYNLTDLRGIKRLSTEEGDSEFVWKEIYLFKDEKLHNKEVSIKNGSTVSVLVPMGGIVAVLKTYNDKIILNENKKDRIIEVVYKQDGKTYLIDRNAGTYSYFGTFAEAIESVPEKYKFGGRTKVLLVT